MRGVQSEPTLPRRASRYAPLMPVRCGFGSAEITPPVGTPMAGYPRVRLDLPWTPDAIRGYVGCLEPSAGVHDPLQAVALAVEVNGTRCVLIGLDTLVVTSGFTTAVRSELQEEGVDGDDVLIGASHTHGGPDVFGFWEVGEGPPPEQATVAATVLAARRALDDLEAATLYWGEAEVPDVSINRRDERHGPTDPAVSVLSAKSQESGEVIGLLVNFACHPVTLDYSNLDFTADYVWALRETVRAVYPSAAAVFLNGAAGNINPARYPYDQKANIYIPQTKENYPVYWGGYDDALRMGRVLGAAAIQATERSRPLEARSITSRRSDVELPLKSGEDLDAFLDFMAFRASYRSRLQALDGLPTEVQRISIGDLSIVGLPGEPFVELGLELKRSSTSPLLVAGYANDDVRYVLTDESYDGGQYETVGTPLAAGAAATLVSAARSIL